VDPKTKCIGTGIEGFDRIINGGIPAKNQLLLAGGPGTGKTLLSLEVLYNVAHTGIPSAFITLDERSENVLNNFKSTFPEMKDVDDLIQKKMLLIDGHDSAVKISANTGVETNYSLGNFVSDMESIIKTVDAQFAVVDSLSFLKLMLGNSILYSKIVSSLVSNFRRLGVTAIFTTDIPYYNRKKIKFPQEILLFDGLIELYHMNGDSNSELAMEVIKMRGQNHDRRLCGYEITENGIKFK
jgi:KaiC/GvpD/RAD55 family RecA-like ATPase